MRKFIIDTDTGSDDAVALMMALLCDDVEVLGITTVCGNVPLNLATKNALMTAEICNSDIQIFEGASKPLFRDLVTAVNVHGNDGMGDCNLINPTKKQSTGHAVDFILETIKSNPNQIEIIALGPVTNIALAILKEPETMKKIKRIWSMGTGGFGPGNTTPVAEFNVYVDAESYSILLNSKIPLTIIGFDLCLGDSALQKEDMEYLKSKGAIGKFAVDCNLGLLNYNFKKSGGYFVDLPDAVAMGVALWDDIVLEKKETYCYCCTKEEPSYGQVIIFDRNVVLAIDTNIPTDNATVIKSIDRQLFKQRMIEVLSN